MKNHFFISFATLLLLAVTVYAQANTAFTYQGRLTDNSTAANGSYDLQFALFDAVSDGAQQGALVHRDDVVVTNGVFTVHLDFGSAPFATGAPRFLQISVRPGNSTEAYIPLTPRQPLAPTPYALHALTAATADTATNATNATTATNATQLGGLDASQFVTGAVVRNVNGLAGNVTLAAGANVTLTPSGNTLTIAATDGTGGAGGLLPWETVTGTSVQAQPNRGYIADNNAAQVVVTLPAAPNVGDIVRVAGAGAGGWRISQNAGQSIDGSITNNGDFPNVWTPILNDTSRSYTSIASSADGMRLVAGTQGNFIYTSDNSGQSWRARLNDTGRDWASVASSADGMRLVAAHRDGFIYTSGDAGVNWIARTAASSRRWSDVASSADGTHLVAVVVGGRIYTSTDAGANWTAHEVDRNWEAVASSADGIRLVAVERGGQIHTSGNAGVGWTSRALPGDSGRLWADIASSANGFSLVAVVNQGQIYTSIDAGVTWTARESNRAWTSVSSSSDGTRLIAAVSPGRIYSSTDAGVTWTARESARRWQSTALSADGTRAVAGTTPDLESTPSVPGWIFAASVVPGGFLTGGQNSAVELLYLGGGRFQMISSEGTVSVF